MGPSATGFPTAVMTGLVPVIHVVDFHFSLNEEWSFVDFVDVS